MALDPAIATEVASTKPIQFAQLICTNQFGRIRQIGGHPVGHSFWISFAIDKIFGSSNRDATI
jgi:hypothetical protein